MAVIDVDFFLRLFLLGVGGRDLHLVLRQLQAHALELVGGQDGGALQVRRNDGQAIAHRGQVGQRHQRRLAAVEHVDQLQARQALGDGADLLQRFGRFQEHHVRARLHVAFGTRNRRIKPFHRNRIRARDDQCVGVRQRLARDVHLAAHLVRGPQALVVQVAAALGK
ncbi:hypothetical protein G6F24_017097 [Rhizopus arrhizus]|nr:hypothetical protein G6F24_017097 [Rhizopus arrhizus]